MEPLQISLGKESWTLNPKQEKFFLSPKKYVAYVGGRGCGKSLALVLKIIHLMLEYPNNAGLVGRQDYSDLRDCYDDTTEILTKDGWKYFDELTYSDKVLTLDYVVGKADYSDIDRIIAQDYDGEMKYYDGRTLNFCITPEHKLLIKGDSSKNGKKGKTPDWRLEKVQDIKRKHFFLKRDFIWEGQERKSISFTSENHHLKQYTFKMDDWLEFLGWYIAEGNAYQHKTNRTWWINITQSLGKNEKKVIGIKRLLKRMRLPDKLYSSEKFIFGSEIIAKHLLKHCGNGSHRKKVPDYVKCLSARQLRIFLDAYNQGDGYIVGNEKRYNTVSKRLADDIQECILKTGNYAKITIRDNTGKRSFIVNHWATTKHLDYLIIEYSHTRKSFDAGVLTKNIKSVHYKGKIYCVETKPYHTVYVRRNGACFWAGNSTEKDFFDVVYSVFEKQDVKHYKQEHRVVFRNGSSVIFRGLKDVSKMSIRSLNLGFYALEQAEEIDESVVNELDACLRRKLVDIDGNEGIQQAFYLANPTLNWIFRMFKQESHPERELVHGSMMDNANNLGESFLKDQLSKPESWQRVFVYGEFDENILADCAVFPVEYVAAQQPITPIKKNVEGIVIYKEPERGHIYQIGADPTEGIEDNCAAKCVDVMTGQEVASFVARIQPEPFARKLEIMGKMYNNAKIILEINGIGLACLNKLKDYPQMFVREEYDKRAKVMTERLGWKTTASTKPLLVGNFSQLLEEKFVHIADEKTVGEMKTFVYTDEAKTKGMGAAKGFHDDRLMAIMLAFWGLKPNQQEEPLIIGGESEKKGDLFHIQDILEEKQESWLEL